MWEVGKTGHSVTYGNHGHGAPAGTGVSCPIGLTSGEA